MSTIRASNIGALTGSPQSISNINSNVVKAWCNFSNTTGIRGSFGISSWTDTGTGNGTLATSVTFTSTSFVAPVSAAHHGGVTWCPSPYAEAITTSSITYQAANMSAGGTEATVNNMIICGTLA
jgi:hypothetical protein